MKRIIASLLVLTLGFALSGCGKKDEFDIKIVVPAGYSGFSYADEEFSPLEDEITISSGDGLGDTAVTVEPVEATTNKIHKSEYLTPGMPVDMELEKGEWYKVGVIVNNTTDKEKVVYVHIEDIEVRIE